MARVSSAALALQLALQASRATEELVWGTTPVGGSQYGYECGEAIQLESDKNYTDDYGDYYHYLIGLASETTFAVAWSDKYLQRSRAFHPMKCRYQVTQNGTFAGEYAAGSLLLLQNACYLKNSFDVTSCFRREYFPYPVRPNADTVKHNLELGRDETGLDVSSKSKVQLFARPESPLQYGAAEYLEEGILAVEVCSFLGECKPHHGVCQPSFWLVAEYWGEDPWVDAWQSYSSSSFHPHLVQSEIGPEWRQVDSTPEYGPYPHCPTDNMGRAKRCLGNETLVVRVKSFKIKAAQISEGNDFAFKVAYELEWGDRFAVHPCTIDLFRVNTGGRQLRVASELFWSPTLSEMASQKNSRVLSASSTLGVSLDFDKPVTQAINASEQWPKQLILSRAYEVEIFPSPNMKWIKYPYDTQNLELNLAVMSVGAGDYEFSFPMSALDTSDKIDVGDSWDFVSRTAGLTTKDGRSVLTATVTVKRNANSKIYTLVLPAVAFAILDSAGHILMPYDDYANLFAVQALMIGVSIQMLDPGFLGIPSTLNSMPFMQCFMLMLVVGALKTSGLIMGRLYFVRHMTRIDQKLQDEKDASLEAELERLRKKRFVYDCVVKASVPVWYLVSLLVVVAVYNIL